MRILVFSDSHGLAFYMREALQLHTDADIVVYLGDGERDFDNVSDFLKGKQTFSVRGNCDLYSQLGENELFTADGVNVFCTHGHTEMVKYGTNTLIDKARGMGARIALYGHTHEPVTDYVDGLYLMNPGSIRSGSYGVVDITRAGIICMNMKI